MSVGIGRKLKLWAAFQVINRPPRSTRGSVAKRSGYSRDRSFAGASSIFLWPRQAQDFDGGLSPAEIAQDFPFAVSSCRGRPQHLRKRLLPHHHKSVACAHHQVARADGDPSQLDGFVQRPQLLFFASANRKAAAKDRKT